METLARILRRRLWVRWFGLALVLAACSVESNTQRLLLRYDATSDVLDAVLVSQDLSAADKNRDRAFDHVARLVAGEDYLVVHGFVFTLSELDGEVEDDASRLRDLRVVGAFGFVDDNGRPAVCQVLRCAGWSRHVARLNAWFTREMLSAEISSPEPSDAERLRTVRLVEYAKTNPVWFTWKDDGLHLEFPCDEDGVAELRRTLLTHETGKPAPDDRASTFGSSVRVEYEAPGVCHVRIGEPLDGKVQVTAHWAASFDAAFSDALRAKMPALAGGGPRDRLTRTLREF